MSFNCVLKCVSLCEPWAVGYDLQNSYKITCCILQGRPAARVYIFAEHNAFLEAREDTEVSLTVGKLWFALYLSLDIYVFEFATSFVFICVALVLGYYIYGLRSILVGGAKCRFFVFEALLWFPASKWVSSCKCKCLLDG